MRVPGPATLDPLRAAILAAPGRPSRDYVASTGLRESAVADGITALRALGEVAPVAVIVPTGAALDEPLAHVARLLRTARRAPVTLDDVAERWGLPWTTVRAVVVAARRLGLVHPERLVWPTSLWPMRRAG